MNPFQILTDVCLPPFHSNDPIFSDLATAKFSTDVEAVPGQAFTVTETGWGEFEIMIKFHYATESMEKPQTMYHSLRLHPYEGHPGPEVQAWCYEEQIFNEPYEQFYEILTNGPPPVKGGKGKKRMGILNGEVGERTAKVPARTSPGQPFSRETESLELRRLLQAQTKVDEMIKKLTAEQRKKEEHLESLKTKSGTPT
jgi:YEATS domain-containing protein 4